MWTPPSVGYAAAHKAYGIRGPAVVVRGGGRADCAAQRGRASTPLRTQLNSTSAQPWNCGRCSGDSRRGADGYDVERRGIGGRRWLRTEGRGSRAIDFGSRRKLVVGHVTSSCWNSGSGGSCNATSGLRGVRAGFAECGLRGDLPVCAVMSATRLLVSWGTRGVVGNSGIPELPRGALWSSKTRDETQETPKKLPSNAAERGFEDPHRTKLRILQPILLEKEEVNPETRHK